MRSSQNRLKNLNGTVHFTNERGAVACGPIATHRGWLAPTVMDVTCRRCIAMFGADEITGLGDPDVARDPNIVRREQERAARRAAREA